MKGSKNGFRNSFLLCNSIFSVSRIDWTNQDYSVAAKSVRSWKAISFYENFRSFQTIMHLRQKNWMPSQLYTSVQTWSFPLRLWLKTRYSSCRESRCRKLSWTKRLGLFKSSKVRIQVKRWKAMVCSLIRRPQVLSFGLNIWWKISNLWLLTKMSLKTERNQF